MTDVEKLKEAIAVVDWLANGPATTNQQFSMNRDQALNVLLEAARSTLPKMKTVEIEQWVVIDEDGNVRVSYGSRREALEDASHHNQTEIACPFTVVRLTGTAEIPA